jgi:hypothetical protein
VSDAAPSGSGAGTIVYEIATSAAIDMSHHPCVSHRSLARRLGREAVRARVEPLRFRIERPDGRIKLPRLGSSTKISAFGLSS